MIGVVAFWRGPYGFLKTLNEPRIFMHTSDAREPLARGDLVAFTVRDDRRGPRAVHVRIFEAC